MKFLPPRAVCLLIVNWKWWLSEVYGHRMDLSAKAWLIKTRVKTEGENIVSLWDIQNLKLLNNPLSLLKFYKTSFIFWDAIISLCFFYLSSVTTWESRLETLILGKNLQVVWPQNERKFSAHVNILLTDLEWHLVKESVFLRSKGNLIFLEKVCVYINMQENKKEDFM